MYSCISTTVENPEYQDIINILPEIDLFMIQPDSTNYANWLGRKFPDGRSIVEPINLIIIDKISKNHNEAKAQLNAMMSKIGYAPRYGHTSGYFGRMNNKLYPQQPEMANYAFSDYMWAFTNNHSRIFGPYQKDEYNIWIASVSRESGIAHDYSSFSEARDTVAKHFELRSNSKILGKINLKNKIDNKSQSTGDHDGFAIIIVY